ncbi:MAG: prolyl-tRNA synthetase [Candidatus Microsaccharimonas sossegonensis]|uniref:Proline--tRNA ligase n=1 Tax=Candidatus Microsaccharimonas sossegonensis TaxID=2506948 RepID=A0A4Q0AHC1_9BACT|nr:MAG: prolyl-tRNA synthetase [Candidatus Microsaccharimonas sossegonensis]
MRVSNLVTKTSKNAPADEVAKNAQLLIRAGYIYKVMAGVYAYTPLGLRVIENIKHIVREEMNAIGGQELIMTNLQPREDWEITTRWDDKVVDIWFKTKLKDDTEVGLAWSHEEAIMTMMKNYIKSYKDLPVNVYQFQTKLRNEVRAKSGIMRGREFVMKDMYSLSTGQEQHEIFYQATIEAYKKVYDRLGLGQDTYVTFASGGAFTQFSHEFQTICDAGEDTIYVNREKGIAVNEEVLNDETLATLGVTRDELTETKSAEVGNIFNFGTDKSEQMGIFYTDENDTKVPIFLGSYGIGITRVMGVIVEKFSDEKGIVWPETIAPYKVYLVSIGAVATQADALYDELTSRGVEVLYDDRDERAGAKFADAELLGIPYRVTVSERLIADHKFEYTPRNTGTSELLTAEELLAKLS